MTSCGGGGCQLVLVRSQLLLEVLLHLALH